MSETINPPTERLVFLALQKNGSVKSRHEWRTGMEILIWPSMEAFERAQAAVNAGATIA